MVLTIQLICAEKLHTNFTRPNGLNLETNPTSEGDIKLLCSNNDSISVTPLCQVISSTFCCAEMVLLLLQLLCML